MEGTGQGIERRFATERKLRIFHVLALGLGVTAANCGVYYLLPSAGRAQAPMPIWAAAFIFGFPWLLCAARIKWGTALLLDASTLRFVKNSTIVRKLPRTWIMAVNCRKHVILLKHLTEDGRIGKILIGREGFSRGVWNDLCEHLKAFAVRPVRNQQRAA